jgi:hypothetical protein
MFMEKVVPKARQIKPTFGISRLNSIHYESENLFSIIYQPVLFL